MPESRQGRLAPQLRELRQHCLDRWLERLQKTRWGRLPQEELLDHMPDVYDGLATILEAHTRDFSEIEGLARAHAEHRYALGYELPELLTETSWFRSVLQRETLEAGGAPRTDERERLNEALDRVQILSATVFTEKREARLRKLKDEAEYRRLQHEEALEAMTDGYYRLDDSFHFVFVNRAGEPMLGLRNEDVQGMLLWETIPGLAETEIGGLYRQAMQDQRAFEITTRYGLWHRWFEIRAFPGPHGLSVYFRDITERMESQELQERIIGVVGHDLRNPLSAVLLGLHRVASLEDLPDRARKSIERALRSANRMERMIAALLDYTRAQAGGGIAIERAPTDLAAVVEAVQDEFSLSHPDRMQSTVCGDLRGSWDADRLAQVLTNLVSNALRHGDPEAPVTVRAKSEGDEYRIAIHNEGDPIPPDRQARLFQPFEHGSSDGLGLGLYISRNIVEQHGGRIEVESAPATGTTFTIVLPRA